MIDHRWGPAPLPLLLEAELRSHGLGASDAAECARRLGETTGRAARASLFVDLGACSFLSGDVEAAIGSWRRAVSAGQPASHARALLFLGLVYEQLGLSELAISVLTTAVDQQVEPHAHQATTALARAYRASGDFDAAIDQLATATEHQMRRSPEGAETAESLLALGEVAHEAGQVDRAESAWRAAARGDTPPARLAHLQLVSLLCELGRENEARELIERGGLPGDETDAHQRLDRAIFLSERGRSGQAVELLASVNGAALRPADRFRLIETCLREGLVNEAIDDLELLLADPEPAHSLRAAVLLGDVYRLHDMDDEARAMYERATEADHAYWSPWAALTLGDVMFAEGDSEAAVANWVRAASSTVEEMQQLAQRRLTDRVELAQMDQLGPHGSFLGSPMDELRAQTDADQLLGPAALAVPAAQLDTTPESEVDPEPVGLDTTPESEVDPNQQMLFGDVPGAGATTAWVDDDAQMFDEFWADSPRASDERDDFWLDGDGDVASAVEEPDVVDPPVELHHLDAVVETDGELDPEALAPSGWFVGQSSGADTGPVSVDPTAADEPIEPQPLVVALGRPQPEPEEPLDPVDVEEVGPVAITIPLVGGSRAPLAEVSAGADVQDAQDADAPVPLAGPQAISLVGEAGDESETPAAQDSTDLAPHDAGATPRPISLLAAAEQVARNPYASLAPSEPVEPAPPASNPYAELAPDFEPAPPRTEETRVSLGDAVAIPGAVGFEVADTMDDAGTIEAPTWETMLQDFEPRPAGVLADEDDR